MAGDSTNTVNASAKGFNIRGASKRDVAAFARELSVLIDVGMPLLKALRTLARRTSNQQLSAVVSDVAASIEKGQSLSEALSKHPALFDKLFVSVVKVGEIGGVLDQSLRRLANFLEEQARITNKVFYALIYPATVVLLSFVALWVIISYVVPQFISSFPDPSKLPTPTIIVWKLGLFLNKAWWLVIIMIIVAIWAFFTFKKTSAGRHLIDRFKIKCPIIGRFGTKVVAERITTTMATLIRSGIPILDTLKIVGTTARNVIVEDAFRRTAAEVERGQNLSESLAKENIFPPIVIDMIAVGDEAGALDIVLEKVSAMLKDEIDYTLEGLTVLLEPALVIVLGFVIVFIALSVYLPYWRLGQEIFAQ